MKRETEILEIVQEAREYERTKSIRTATNVCEKLVELADKMKEELCGEDDKWD